VQRLGDLVRDVGQPVGSHAYRHAEDHVVGSGPHEAPGDGEGLGAIGWRRPTAELRREREVVRVPAGRRERAPDLVAFSTKYATSPGRLPGIGQPSAYRMASAIPRRRWPPSQSGGPPGRRGGGSFVASRSG